MDPSKPPACPPSAAEVAVRHAMDHAAAQGDHAIAAELAAILESMATRASPQAPGGWDTVPATGRMH